MITFHNINIKLNLNQILKFYLLDILFTELRFNEGI